MADPKVLSLADLAAADADRKVVPVDVPEWGGRVHVRELTALERDRLDEVIYDGEGNVRRDVVRTALVAAALCGPDGTPFGRVGDPGTIDLLAGKSAAAVRRVYDAAAKLNALRREDSDEGKADSGGAPAGGSPSASPSPSSD